MIAGVTFGLLLPFVTKAFHIDDTLFLWIARHIQTDPLDFYGFRANWYGYAMPMSAITHPMNVKAIMASGRKYAASDQLTLTASS